MDSVDTQSWQQHIAAIQAGTDADAVDRAIRAVQTFIETTAQRVCQKLGVNRQMRQDFVANATAFVLTIPRKSTSRPPIATYDPATGPFPTWLWPVLKNKLLDQLKKDGRRAKHEVKWNSDGKEFNASQTRVDSIRDDPRAAIAWNAPFCDHDLKQIGSWKIKKRLVVLIAHNLWHKIPPAIWCNWCREAELPNPFPPEPHDREPIEWVKFLVGKLSETQKALEMQLTVKRILLLKTPLNFIQQIFEVNQAFFRRLERKEREHSAELNPSVSGEVTS